MKKTIKKTSLIIGCFIGWTLLSSDMGAHGAGVTAEENLEKLLEAKSCKGCDLTHLNLNRMDLSGVDLEGADLSFSKLFLTNLAGANLQNTTLTGAQLGGADLGDADLRGADLRGTSLESAYLGGALIDGEFVTSKPYESIGITDVEKDVYVEDQSKPKKHPEKQEVKVGARRDLQEPPPQLQAQKRAEESTQAQASRETVAGGEPPADMVLPQPPAAKRVKPVEAVVIEETEKQVEAAEPVIIASGARAVEEKTVSAQVAGKKEMAPSEDSTPGDIDKPEQQVAAAESLRAEPSTVAGADQETDESTVSAQPGGENAIALSTGNTDDKVDEPEQKENVALAEENGRKQIDDGKSSDPGQLNADLALEKKKRDNLTRLLDNNRCYGCDLAGLDLSGEDFEGADLEGADLSGCNLNKADLEGANLKGAKLENSDLRNADLRDADFYKADLTGADLTGAKMKGAMFDSAVLTDAEGVGSQLLNGN